MSYLDEETGEYVGFDAQLAQEYIYRYTEEEEEMEPAA